MVERHVAPKRAGAHTMADSLYGEEPDRPLLAFLPPATRLLDVGCGSGAWAPGLRAHGVGSLVGVDVSERAAEAARSRYDLVLCRALEDVELADLGDEPFDVIVAADVLEHLVDPWRELRRWRTWLRPGGELVISVPNLRDVRLVVRLVLRGRFDYADEGGVMDRTHLRWFTSASLSDELSAAGWEVGRRGGVLRPRRARLNRLTARRFEDFLAFQLHLAARPARAAGP